MKNKTNNKMKRWQVTGAMPSFYSITVEAATEEEAIEKALIADEEEWEDTGSCADWCLAGEDYGPVANEVE